MYGVCHLSIVPIRSKPSDASEMVSQLLFGETFKILEKRRKWLHIQCSYDDYTGWIDSKQYQPLEEKTFHTMQKHCAYTLELSDVAVGKTHFIPLVMGSTLPNCDGINFKFNQTRFTYSGRLINPKAIDINIDILLKIANRFLNAPYLWGGRSPFGIDFSGFTQSVFKMIGIPLKRDSSQQVHQGETVDFFDKARAGDLAFFENPKGKIVHVGIIIPDNQIIHASGQVRIDSLDATGIYNQDRRKYTHKLRIIKRFLSDSAFPYSLED